MKPSRPSIVVLVVGLAFTAAGAWAAARSDDHNEDRLLQVQTRQAASVIGAAVSTIVEPLHTSLQVAAATTASAPAFAQTMSPDVGPRKTFISAALLRADDGRTVASLGEPAHLTEQPSTEHEILDEAATSKAYVVRGFPKQRPRYIGYALRSGPYIVYAERAIPTNRQVPVESNSAFADLHFATYLGPDTRTPNVATTDRPLSDLPLTGRTARTTIPFGNTVITLVAAPDGHLGGSLGQQLPWIIFGLGVVLSLLAALATHLLVVRRRKAESDAVMIASLYEEVNTLYGEQRSIAFALQRALLPQRDPTIPQLDIASRYVAGARGVDVGGDWYSIIQIDERHFAFVVGDVMGRGVDAATTMARLRYTLRAYLLEGHEPAVALDMTGQQLDLVEDGHFATLLVGIGDLETGQLTIANAGHLDPLLLSRDGARYLPTLRGPALGIVHGSVYRTIDVRLEPGSTLLLFTDGLVERRGESIDEGLERLRALVGDGPAELEPLVDTMLRDLIGADAEDDTVLLAFRWQPDPVTVPSAP